MAAFPLHWGLVPSCSQGTDSPYAGTDPGRQNVRLLLGPSDFLKAAPSIIEIAQMLALMRDLRRPRDKSVALSLVIPGGSRPPGTREMATTLFVPGLALRLPPRHTPRWSAWRDGSRKWLESGSGVTLPSPRPLRTVHATFTAHGSSLDKAPRSTRHSTRSWLVRFTQ